MTSYFLPFCLTQKARVGSPLGRRRIWTSQSVALVGTASTVNRTAQPDDIYFSAVFLAKRCDVQISIKQEMLCTFA